MQRYVCLHGHFYQPPRENPWLEAIEFQDSAYPFHDWNQRITVECYAPNAASRILDGEDHIVRIVNNYSRISFNFGPTLLAWLAEQDPATYRAILAADGESIDRYGGHGSALAQAYNHMILPLADARDKRTQVAWGIRDFEHRFRRRPEGMWLPETAVDLETLEILADHGMAFTILAPNQAARVRPIKGRRWREVNESRIDPTMPYLAKLPSGREIALFFYDGPVSRAVAFEDTLRSGEAFAERLLGAFSDGRDWPQLVHIATDGETYGHHRRFADMALAYALNYIQSRELAVLTNYGQFLERHPPTHEVEIFEASSWSCVHGVERWRGDCGCRTGGHPEWNQAWRAPLRAALDWLRDRTRPAYESRAADYLVDPWAARDDYIEVLLERSAPSRERFLARHRRRELTAEDRVQVWKLLELQRNAMLMYTSCGWFFDEISGIESVQVLQYAGRHLQLAGELFGEDLEPEFLARLEKAPSNLTELGHGAEVYRRYVKPAMIDLNEVGAHHAVSLLFQTSPAETEVYRYRVERRDHRVWTAGRAKLAVGRLHIASDITEEEAEVDFGVLHFGDHNLTGGVRAYRDETAYRAMADAVAEPFSKADIPEVVRRLDRHYDGLTYSLKSLFRDEQRKVLRIVLQSTLDDAEVAYRQLYENHAPLMRFLTELRMPLPNALRAAGEYLKNKRLLAAATAERPDLEALERLFQEAAQESIPLDAQGLGYALQQLVERALIRFREKPGDLERIDHAERAARLVRTVPIDVNVGMAQNLFYELLQTRYPEHAHLSRQGDENSRAWVLRFVALGRALRIRVD